MIAFFGVYAKESVSIRCNEIKNMLKDFEAKLEARKQLLQISLDVFTCLDQVRSFLYLVIYFYLIFFFNHVLNKIKIF